METVVGGTGTMTMELVDGGGEGFRKVGNGGKGFLWAGMWFGFGRKREEKEKRRNEREREREREIIRRFHQQPKTAISILAPRHGLYNIHHASIRFQVENF